MTDDSLLRQSIDNGKKLDNLIKTNNAIVLQQVKNTEAIKDTGTPMEALILSIEALTKVTMKNNKLLTEIAQKEFPEIVIPEFPDIPKTDMSSVEGLLKEQIEQKKQPCQTNITLELK